MYHAFMSCDVSYLFSALDIGVYVLCCRWLMVFYAPSYCRLARQKLQLQT